MTSVAIYRVPIDLSWNGSGSPGVNVWHIETGDNPTGVGVETIIALLRGFYEDLLTVLGGPMTVRFAGEVVEVNTDVRAGAPTWSISPAATNQYAAFPLALVVSWRTVLASRSATGRTFIGPLAASVDGSTGTPSAAVVAQLQAAATELIEAVETAEGDGGSRLVVYSRLTGQATAIQSGRVRTQFSVLRSRRD